MEMLFWNAIKFSHVSFSLIPKIFDTVDVIILIGKQFRMVDSVVFKLRYIKGVIASKRVILSGFTFCLIIGNKVSVLALGMMTVKP